MTVVNSLIATVPHIGIAQAQKGERQNERGRQSRHLPKSARAKHTSAVPPHKLELRATRWRRPRFLHFWFTQFPGAGSTGCGREQLSPGLSIQPG